ncbi:MAG: hypothetical protein GYA51_08450 [Candidatus Methanofastidiosa archaeon]|jgi:hypothetical protein|nr:hypothetical protein [Candidatus Methanofastidiosa archaeon]
MVNKRLIFTLILLFGIIVTNQPYAKAENFVYSFGVSSDSVDIDSFSRITIITDANIDEDYTYLVHQVILSDAPQRITFETNLPKNLVNTIDVSYRDSNLSWNNLLVSLDSNSTNVKFSMDTEGKKGISEYQFNIVYAINSQYVYNSEPNILNSFDFLISNELSQEDLATLTITIPKDYKPFNSAGWRLQGNRFFYSTVISEQSNVNAIFYLEEDYGDSIDSLKNEITKLTQENAKLTEKIIEMQNTVESYKVRNDELTSDVKDLKNELVQSNEERKASDNSTRNFRHLSWGLTLSIPGMQFLLNELREKNKISSTQLHLGSVIGTFIVFLILYLTLFL